MPKLLLATSNRGKLSELRRVLDGCGWELVSPADLDLRLPDEETGETYEVNAKIKAHNGVAGIGLVTLADDSGLEIDALPGELGLRSARFLGPETSYRERFRIILERLQGLPTEKRTARFRCLMAITEPATEQAWLREGIVEGLIAEAPRGEGGFGYDPIFWVPEYAATMAELPPQVKNAISHRGRAAAEARPLLEELRQTADSAAPSQKLSS